MDTARDLIKSLAMGLEPGPASGRAINPAIGPGAAGKLRPAAQVSCPRPLQQQEPPVDLEAAEDWAAEDWAAEVLAADWLAAEVDGAALVSMALASNGRPEPQPWKRP